VSSPEVEPSQTAKWDPPFVKRAMELLRPIVKGYHRSEVRGLESFPSGGALVVSNHSGGLIAIDVPVFAHAFYEHFGYGRPVFTLTHDLVFKGPVRDALVRAGFIPASHENAAAALGSGGALIVFPGGDFDAYRSTSDRNTIDFNGRTGYVRAAIEAGVPIVPTVSIGGQENQIYLSRGTGLARALKLDKLARVKILPISFGFPFGLSVLLPFNVPLPTKIVTQVLDPIDIAAKFGEHPDVGEVDARVRQVMQHALDKLAKERRFPVIG
jgi:1-acyl-sn-glycerol-3-phosphate acyltransferase